MSFSHHFPTRMNRKTIFTKTGVITIAAASALSFAACSDQSDTENAAAVMQSSSAAVESPAESAAADMSANEGATPADNGAQAPDTLDGQSANGQSANGSSTEGQDSQSAPGAGSPADETSASTGGANTDGGMKSDLNNALTSGVQVGDTFTAGGETLTACVVGDGYGLNIVAAGSNTSCEFATNVFDAQTEGLNPTGDNIRDNLSPSVEASSPATGQSYTVNCSEDTSGVITCTGGNNAKVVMN